MEGNPGVLGSEGPRSTLPLLLIPCRRSISVVGASLFSVDECKVITLDQCTSVHLCSRTTPPSVPVDLLNREWPRRGRSVLRCDISVLYVETTYRSVETLGRPLRFWILLRLSKTMYTLRDWFVLSFLIVDWFRKGRDDWVWKTLN